MNSAIKWRIVSLQAFLVVVLAGAAVFAYGLGSFTTSQIRDELTAQQVYFPGADQIKAGGALDPKEFPQEIRDQAGNQVTDGNQARIYANDFIGKHLQGVANGLTYASVGTKVSQLNAQLATTPKDSLAYADLQKQIATLNAQRDTLFKGETLRSSLLNAYGARGPRRALVRVLRRCSPAREDQDRSESSCVTGVNGRHAPVDRPSTGA